MPTTNSRNLTLTTVDDNVTVNVKYNAVFSPFERFLASKGLKFSERIRVIGADPSGSTTGSTLYEFPVQYLPVTAGDASQSIARNRSVVRPRAAMQEDPGLGDDDEIVCRIEIAPVGMPGSIAAYTDQESLHG